MEFLNSNHDNQSWNNLPSQCSSNNTEFLRNATDQEIIGPWLRTYRDQMIVFLIFPAIIAFGVATNSLFLITLARVKSMRTVTNYYLAHLSCCDIAFILLTAGENLYDNAYSPIKGYIFYKTPVTCALVTFLQHVTLFSSITLVTLVSFERFMAICYPVKHRLFGGMKHTKVVVMGCWLWSSILGVISTPLVGAVRTYCVLWPDRDLYHSLPLVIHRCEAILPFFRSFTRGLRLCYFILAVISNTIMYYRIIAKLNNRIQPLNQPTSGTREIAVDRVQHVRKSSNRVAAMLIANGAVFFLCLAPYRVIEVYVLMAERGNVGHLSWIDPLAVIGLWTWCINSMVNPIIYGLANPRYRRSFWKVLKCSSTVEIDNTDMTQATNS